MVCCGAALLLGLGSLGASAQPSGTATTQLSETVELTRLVDLCAQRLSLNIEYDTKLSGSSMIRLRSELSDGELWALTNRLLAARGYTTVRMGEDGTLSVVQLASAAGLARLESLEDLAGDGHLASPGFRSVLVPARARRVEDLVSALKPLLSTQGGSVTGLPESGSVIVADLTPRLELALRAIEAMESGAAAGRPVEIAVIEMPAGRMITLLKQLAALRDAAGAPKLRGELLASPDDRSVLVIAPDQELEQWRELISQFDRREAVETLTYTPTGFSVGEVAASLERLIGGEDAGMRIIADELTGTLQVTATPAQHARIEEVLTRLSVAPETARRPTRTFRLKNRDAEEVLGVVQSLVTAGMVGTTSMQGSQEVRSVGDGEDRAIAQAGRKSESLQMTADPATNAIIAIGEVQELDRLAKLLDDLDVRRPQVQLEFLIVSLSESDSFDLGVEMEKLIIGPGDTIGKLSSLFGLSSTGAASGDIADRSSGGSAIVLSPGDFSVVVKALRAVNQGRSLSMPKVLVASNEQASINSVLENPFTTINASDTVATTAYGGSSNAGTEVSVTPQIAEGDHLRLEYQVSLSAFVGEAADASVPPPKQQNSINSVATIPDGFTIAVGGIELVTEGEAETGIPLISDIPLLGEAFKNRSKSSSRSRFYVFIRSTILRDRSFEDLKYLSEADIAETGVEDGWPVPEPRVIK